MKRGQRRRFSLRLKKPEWVGALESPIPSWRGSTDRMCGSGERRPLHRGPLLRPVVPEHHLARVGAADDQVRVEAGERGAHHRRLAVEDILGRRLLELGVPHEADAVRVVRRLLIVVVAVGREYRVGGYLPNM